jgi:hypothetical protein
MNPNVRTYLIDLARKKRNNIVYYSDLARDCNLGLNLDNPRDRNELSKTLGDVSAFEYSQGRPLVSSLVLYKQNDDHGGGFYDLAESLGIGKAKTLSNKGFGFREAARSAEFWLNEDNYSIS